MGTLILFICCRQGAGAGNAGAGVGDTGAGAGNKAGEDPNPSKVDSKPGPSSTADSSISSPRAVLCLAEPGSMMMSFIGWKDMPAAGSTGSAALLPDDQTGNKTKFGNKTR